MYYAEKVINGIIHCRTTPNGQWKPRTHESLSLEIQELRKMNERLSKDLEKAEELYQRWRSIRPA